MSTEKELMKLVADYGKECISAGIAELNSSDDVKQRMASDVRKSHDALTARLRAILTELEAAREDVALVDWLEQSKEHHGFCGTGYGEYRYYAGQCDGWGSVRKVIEAARKGEA
jgi:hypothetical protein